MFKTRQVVLTIFLTGLLIFTQFMQPISSLAESLDFTEKMDLKLFKTIEEIELIEGVFINKDTYLYGEIENDEVRIKFSNSYKSVPLESFVEITNENSNSPKFYEIDEEITVKTIPRGTSLYSLEPNEQERILLNIDIDYPVKENEYGFEVLYIGNIEYFVSENERNTVYESLINDTVDNNDEITFDEGIDNPIEDEINNEIQANEDANVSPFSTNSIKQNNDNLNVQNAAIDDLNDQSEDSNSEINEDEIISWENAKYFKVLTDNLTVYYKENNTLIPAGKLIKEQVYPIISINGNWLVIKFGNTNGYVWKNSTEPADKDSINNENNNYKNQMRTFITLQDVTVYDNSSGSLVAFGIIDKGQNYPIVSDYGNWWRIIFADRVGYVNKKEVAAQYFNNDKYFKADIDLPIYDNRTGKLIKVGEVKQGQVYSRVSDYGNWHRIQFGNIYGYVSKSGTSPASGSEISNLNNNYKNQSRSFTTLKNVTVYDNTSGNLIPFGKIENGVEYPIVSDYGNWWRIVFSDRVGYINKNDVQVNFIENDKYFRADIDLPIYDNRTGKLIKVGEVKQGQIYPRVSDYGNWHRIQFGNIYGYVSKSRTSPAMGNEIKNLNQNFKPIAARSFKVIDTAVVYDNSSGKLVPFGTIIQGFSDFSITADYGNWWRIIYADRVGYISKDAVQVATTPSDNYFRAINNIPVYDNRTGSLVKVGELVKGQSYPIVSDYGNWWKVRFGTIYGYVRKSDTGYATPGEMKNLNVSYKHGRDNFITGKKVPIYDNSSGELVIFGYIEKDQFYPIVSSYGDNWWRVVYLDRVGYVRKSDVQDVRIYRAYDISLRDAVNKQMTVKPQTDIYNGEIYASEVVFSSINENTKKGTIRGGSRIRTGPSTDHHILYQVPNNSNRNVSLIEKVKNSNNETWWKITRNSIPTWINATPSQVEYYMNPNNFKDDPKNVYQFLDLSYYTWVPLDELNSLINNKGVLHGKASVFMEAAKDVQINEVYLISHALLETGNGSSNLASGVIKATKISNNRHLVIIGNEKYIVDYYYDRNRRTITKNENYNTNGLKLENIYNFFGIGAFDDNAAVYGAVRAFDEKWYSPEAAIKGGAKFVKNDYIGIGQNTLYKMRWNPDALVKGRPTHQYATDVGWANKQVSNLHRIYSKGNYNLRFEIPVYK